LSQEEVVEALSDSVFPLSLSEICEKLNNGEPNLKTKVIGNINKLIKSKEIKYINLDRLLAKKFFNCNHKMKLYYL